MQISIMGSGTITHAGQMVAILMTDLPTDLPAPEEPTAQIQQTTGGNLIHVTLTGTSSVAKEFSFPSVAFAQGGKWRLKVMVGAESATASKNLEVQ